MSDTGSAPAKPVPVPVRAPDTMLLVFTTLPDLATAQAIARTLVEERLAACVSVGAPVNSVYRWQGAIESADEVPLTIKTAASRFADLATRLKALHPYELPEIVAVRPDTALPAYAAWVIAQTRQPLV